MRTGLAPILSPREESLLMIMPEIVRPGADYTLFTDMDDQSGRARQYGQPAPVSLR